MDFHQLRIFTEVVRQKSFSRAADAIFLSQPTVSAHIKSLENEIGAPLIDRSHPELQVTSAGQVLFQYAQQLLAIKETALTAIQREHSVIKGHVEIAASSVPGTYILPRLMKSFADIHPEVSFAVTLHDTGQVYDHIESFSHDIGFVGEASRSEGLTSTELAKDELILIVGPDMPWPSASTLGELPVIDLTKPSDLETFFYLPFIFREPGSATRTVFEKALEPITAQSGQSLNIIAYLEGQEAIKEAVKAGLGVTVISQRAVEDDLAAGRLRGYRLAGLTLKRSFYLIQRKNRIFSPATQAFLQHCLEHISP